MGTRPGGRARAPDRRAPISWGFQANENPPRLRTHTRCGERIDEQVLADLCLESEAATLSALRLARAYDEGDRALVRLGTAVLKHWVCKRGPVHAAEALEVLGGNGYVEESGMPRIYREQPVNSVWEGSGNVMCLDVLRGLARNRICCSTGSTSSTRPGGRTPGSTASWRSCEASSPISRTWSGGRGGWSGDLRSPCRALLVRHGLPASADAFCAGRLAGDAGLAFGTLPPGIDARAIVEHHRPRVG